MTRCGHGVMTARTPATDDMCDHQFVSLLCEKCADRPDPGFPQIQLCRLCGKKFKKIEIKFRWGSLFGFNI
jgi:hypothetical protein